MWNTFVVNLLKGTGTKQVLLSCATLQTLFKRKLSAMSSARITVKNNHILKEQIPVKDLLLQHPTGMKLILIFISLIFERDIQHSKDY